MSGIEEADYKELETRIDLLDALYLVQLNQFKEVKRIWHLPGMTPDVWEYYKLHDLDGMKELTLLRNALVKLKLSIREIITNARKQKPTS